MPVELEPRHLDHGPTLEVETERSPLATADGLPCRLGQASSSRHRLQVPAGRMLGGRPMATVFRWLGRNLIGRGAGPEAILIGVPRGSAVGALIAGVADVLRPLVLGL